MASRLGKKRLFLVWSCLVSILPGMAQTEKLIDYVNPFVGTDGYGNVYPVSYTHLTLPTNSRV